MTTNAANVPAAAAARVNVDLRALARIARAWPFAEARRVLARIEAAPPGQRRVVRFETGYGPSGLPHIGTFGEVVRTTMVRHAFSLMSDVPTELIVFSDDMDGLRKVPDNVPNRETLARFLGRPLSAVPDPFGTHPSFGAHNNARLKAFLDRFGFDYVFASATDYYRRGVFDDALRRVLEHYDEIIAVILPTLGPTRRRTYSPFLPVCARTGQVLQVPVVDRDTAAGTIVYRDDDGRTVETAVTGGACKLQWKVDWAMRWAALGIDYEMSGKDLIDSVRLSTRICKVLGGLPPETFIYELFLDERGEKISKSKGNGLSVEDWLRYGPEESLSFFMYQKPQSAKRLFFDVIPKNTDDYLDQLSQFENQTAEQRVENPVWHIHAGAPPPARGRLSLTMLLNLAAVCHTEDQGVLWSYISRYDPELRPGVSPLWDGMVARAVNYYRDFVKPALIYRSPTEPERAALQELAACLRGLSSETSAEDLQTLVYEVGKRHPVFPTLRDWFRCLYEVLMGKSDGPRMGPFIALYGIEPFVALLDTAVGRTSTG